MLFFLLVAGAVIYLLYRSRYIPPRTVEEAEARHRDFISKHPEHDTEARLRPCSQCGTKTTGLPGDPRCGSCIYGLK